MHRLWSTTGISILLCLLGCLLLFLPWASGSVTYVDPTIQTDGSYKMKALPSTEVVLGYALWQGVGSAAIFLGLLVFLVITSPLTPIPWWRSAVVLSGGAVIAGAVILGMNNPPRRLESDLQSGRLVIGTSRGAANYASLGLGTALVFVAAVELRRSVARSRDRQQSEGMAQGGVPSEHGGS